MKLFEAMRHSAQMIYTHMGPNLNQAIYSTETKENGTRL